MKAAEDETRLREIGRKIFAGEADFKWASTAIDNLPPMNSVEIAFAGRSNVGKSSLVNALTNRKTLARTSHTPGRTQQLNFFDIGGHFMLVDMPGYGYAAVSKAKVEAWTDVIIDYLKGRANLARVYVLIDGRHGVKDVDRDVMKSKKPMLKKCCRPRVWKLPKGPPLIQKSFLHRAEQAMAFPICAPPLPAFSKSVAHDDAA
jgi:GTP-binding protein